MAHRVISLRHSNWVAFGLKRTSGRVYEISIARRLHALMAAKRHSHARYRDAGA
jgi:hypothetical protein